MLRMFRPTLFGKYLLTHRLAVGGMAEIYKAKVFGVSGFEKDLVVKQILPQYAKYREFIDMFVDEAKITVSLSHGNIVPVYELGRIEGIYFIAMEFIHGRDLSQTMLRADELDLYFSPEQAVAVIIDTLKGLDYAHRRKDRKGESMGIVHRDVSPQNVVVSFDGEVKILDFGIAKAAQRLSATHPGAVRGKFGYLSPEQASGKPVDRRADIFAAGTVLWELLTMKRLFGTGTEAQALDNIRKAVVEPPSSINPDVPEALDDLVLQALQKSPDARYKDAGAFQLALSKFLYSSGGAVTSESIGNYMKRIFAEHLDAEEAADGDPRRQAEVERLYEELAEKLKGQSTDPGRRPRRPRRRTHQGVPPERTRPGIGTVSDQRTPTRPRHTEPSRDGTPLPPNPPTRPPSSQAVAVSGNPDQEGKTQPVDGLINSDSIADKVSASEALTKAANPNYDLDAFLTEMAPEPDDEPEDINIASKSALQYEVFASREADLEESIFAHSGKSTPVGWLLAVVVAVLFSGWLLATQTNVFKGSSPPKKVQAKPQLTGHVVVRVRPKFDRSKTVPVRYRIYWHQGSGPATLTDLPMGQSHRVLVELAGYKAQWVNIPKNAWKPRPKHPGSANAWQRKLQIRLAAGSGKPPEPIIVKPPSNTVIPPPGHTGRLLIDTEPSGAQIWLLAGDEFQAEHLNPKKIHRFMGLSRLGRGRIILTIRPYKTDDDPGDWTFPKRGGNTLHYQGVLNMK
jgi:serine/threonine protein kinase